MTREEKIRHLKALSEGTIKPLDLVNHGFWTWVKKGNRYQCEVNGYKHLKLTLDQFQQFTKNGGHHTVFEKSYKETYKQVYSDLPEPSFCDPEAGWGWGLPFIPKPTPEKTEVQERPDNGLRVEDTVPYENSETSQIPEEKEESTLDIEAIVSDPDPLETIDPVIPEITFSLSGKIKTQQEKDRQRAEKMNQWKNMNCD